ncbi:MAG: hypothetical protein HY879_04020 [Deltaproteobacteria bacterium]|nr:hypothetical protein [Deltaproteobacteria bacterium]
MPDSSQIQKTRKKSPFKKTPPESRQEPLSQEKQRKLKELDDYIESVLQEAGEDFLDRFKQVEGE